MMHVELPLGAFIAACLVLVPLPWHWRARNVPTLSIIAWLFISNFIFGINAIIWAGNVEIIAQVWCDIVTKLQIGATIALPACCLCLCIHLERIASIRNMQTGHAQKRRRMIFDLVLCWGLPIIYMVLHYIVQGHRYDIVEDFGCRPAIYNSIQSLLIVWMLPSLVVTLTLIFATLALVHFFHRRVAFARHLQDSNSALSTSRYFRLMAMAVVQMFWGALVIGINMWFTCRAGLRPWISWEDVHFNFSRVGQFPTVFNTAFVLRWTYFIWWTIPISSVLFFAFFSFGEDAVKEYKTCLRWLARVVFRRKEVSQSKSMLPSFIRPPVSHVPIPKMSMSTSTDTKSTQSTHFEFDSKSNSDDHKSRPASFDMSSSFIATPTTITSFPTCDSNSTFVAPSPSLCAPPRHSAYSSRADEHA